MPDTRPDFVELYRPANHAQLALLRPALDAAGIQYFVKNEFASIGARVATGADELSLMVAAAQFDEAHRLIEEIYEYTPKGGMANRRFERPGAFAGLRFAWLEGSMTRSSDQTVRQAGSAPAAQAQVR